MRMQNWLLSGAAALALLSGQNTIVEAQQITGALHGQVTMPNGALVAGATVQIVNTTTGATANTTTSGGGAFNATGLQIGGPYTVKIDGQGRMKTLQGIFVQLGQTLQLQVSLDQTPGGTVSEDVVVTGLRTGSSSAQVETRGAAQAFNSNDIRDTPMVSRDFKEIIQQSPFAYIDPVGGGSAPPVPTLNLSGGNPRCSNFLVDGLQQKDNFGLNLQGYPTARSPLPPDWTDQVQVAVTPYDVEYNDTCGGVINIVTKSGTNDFHGSLYYELKNDSLSGAKFDNITGATVVKPPLNEKSYGFTLGGPIIQDRLFFFAGYDRVLSTTSPFGDANAVGPNGSGAGRVATNISLAQANEVGNIAKTVYGLEPGDPTALFTEDNKRYIGKLTWQINDDHRITGVYQYVKGGTLTPQGGSNSTSTAGNQVTLPSDWYIDAETMKTWSVQTFDKWSDVFSTQLSGGHIGVIGAQTPVGGVNFFPTLFVRTKGPNNTYETPGTALSSTDDGYVVVGPDFSRQWNYLAYKNDFGKAIGTLNLGTHVVKGGVEYHKIAILDQFLQGAGSVIRFDSVTDFQNGIIATSPLNSSFTSGVASSGLQGTNSIFVGNGAPPLLKPTETDANFKFGLGSLFLEDEWYLTDELNVQLGLRYDRYDSKDKPVLNTNFQKRYGFSNQGNVDGLSAWDPRASFSYNPADWFEDIGVTIRGGIGKYSGGFQTVWITNNYGNTGVTSVSAAGIPGSGSFASIPSNLVTAGVLTGGHFDEQKWLDLLNAGPLSSAATAANSTTNELLPSFQTPSTWRMNLGTDVSFRDGFLGDGWKTTAEFLHLSSKDQPYWTNLRLQPSATKAPDGRILYQWTFDPSASTPRNDPAGGVVCPAAPPVSCAALTGSDLALGSVDGGTGTFLIGAVSKEWKQTPVGDLRLSFNYTHSKLTDITPSTSSTASSNYGNRASLNFNEPEVGTSDYERQHRFTAQLNWGIKEGESETRFNFFFQRMSGQHYSYTFSGSPFGPAGTGTTTNKSLLYVPAVDPSTGLVTGSSDPKAVFKPGFDLAGFNDMLKSTGLIAYAGQIVPRNAFSGRWDSLLNFSAEQEFATPFEGHHFVLSMSIFNLGNLINRHWGQYTSPNFYQAYTVATVDALTGTTSSCSPVVSPVSSKYCYTAFNSAATLKSNFTTSRGTSVWSMQFGARYEF